MADKGSSTEAARFVNEYKGGRGVFTRIIITAVIVAVAMLAIMILSKLNMGEVPSLFGFSLERFFEVG